MSDYDVMDDMLKVKEVLFIYSTIRTGLMAQLDEAKNQIIEVWEEQGAYSEPGQLEELETMCVKEGRPESDAKASIAISWYILKSDETTRMKHYGLYLLINHMMAQIHLLNTLSDSLVNGLEEAHKVESGNGSTMVH